MLFTTTAKRHSSPRSGPQPRARWYYQTPRSPRQSTSKEHGMSKPKPIIFTVAVAVATLAPAATANAGVILNHNETLLLDA
jgi:hypothetical protein